MDAWTGILEIDAALKVYREAEASYMATCDSIMKIEGSSWRSVRLAKLEAKATVDREALDEASRKLDEVGGERVAKLLRLGHVSQALGCIRRLTCACGAQAAVADDGGPALCGRCRRAKSLRQQRVDTEDLVLPLIEGTAEETAPPAPPPVDPAPDSHENSFEAATILSVDDASLVAVTEPEKPAEPVKNERVSVMGGSDIKARLVGLRDAHAGYEKVLSELAKASANGDSDEVQLLLADVANAEIEVATAKASVFGAMSSAPKSSTPKKAAVAKPAQKAVRAAKSAAPGGAIAGWLRAVRAGVGLSQVVFGEKIGASETQMWNWENGRRVPGDEFVSKIEKLVGKTCPHKQTSLASVG